MSEQRGHTGRERRRRHDDAHLPLQGRGKRAARGMLASTPPLVPSEPACRRCWFKPCRCAP